MKYFHQKKSTRNLCFGLLFLMTVWILCIYYIRNFTVIVGWVNVYERPHLHFNDFKMKPPTYMTHPNSGILNELKSILTTANSSETRKAATDQLFDVLSNIVQDQLSALQQKSCAGTNIVCGHQDLCGLGCQIHHRTACLIISYALGVPMIHDENESWPYAHKWSSAFSPLGSQCKIGPQTYRLKWAAPYPILNKVSRFSNNSFYEDRLEYPLKDGILVSREIADIVESIHEQPFLWWIGQFIKFAMRRTHSMEATVEGHKTSIRYSKPIVGMHIRRTDKIQESAFIPTERYFSVAEKFFSNSSTRKVFAATDDISLLKEVYTEYSSKNWDIIGFKDRKTYKDQHERAATLPEIVTDLFLLAESDFVVCTFSSNVCRLLLEMRSYMFPSNGTKYLTSLDDTYKYILLGSNLTERIVKIG